MQFTNCDYVFVDYIVGFLHRIMSPLWLGKRRCNDYKGYLKIVFLEVITLCILESVTEARKESLPWLLPKSEAGPWPECLQRGMDAFLELLKGSGLSTSAPKLGADRLLSFLSTGKLGRLSSWEPSGYNSGIIFVFCLAL